MIDKKEKACMLEMKNFIVKSENLISIFGSLAFTEDKSQQCQKLST